MEASTIILPRPRVAAARTAERIGAPIYAVLFASVSVVEWGDWGAKVMRMNVTAPEERG